MDPVRLGRQVRALRRRKRLRQVDVAARAGVSSSSVSRLELGEIQTMTLRALEAVARSLGARLDVRLSWNGEALDRLLDADHAALVEIVARTLRSLGWEVVVEASFAIRGERGSIDVLARHPAGSLLVVEVKSVVPDLQLTIVTLDRKARLAREIARERGWAVPPDAIVSRLLVVAEGRTARRRVEQHAETFRAAFPARGQAVRRWLASPGPGQLAGLLFVPVEGRATRHRTQRPPSG
jgi:transcriptional regulator with XRE-family HTH domain